MRVFEDAGGKVVQRMFPPLDRARLRHLPRAAQDRTSTASSSASPGSNGFRFLRQFNEYGLIKKVTPVGGMTALDEAVLRNMGDEALGIVTSCWYSAEIDNPINKKFAAGFRKQLEVRPGLLRRGDLHRGGGARRRRCRRSSGKIEDKQAFMKAVRSVKFDTCARPGAVRPVRQRGRQRLHPQGRAQGRAAGQPVIHTYPNVSQFWTYKPEEFLKNPVYSRDFPPTEEA